jgi:hypothetical protein
LVIGLGREGDRVRTAAVLAPWKASAHHPAMDVPNEAIKQVEVLPRGDEHGDWRWLAEQLLERAHWELERADEKANTLFRLYGVVLAAGVAFSVTGNSRSLNVVAGSILLVAAIFGLTAGGCWRWRSPPVITARSTPR